MVACLTLGTATLDLAAAAWLRTTVTAQHLPSENVQQQHSSIVYSSGSEYTCNSPGWSRSLSTAGQRLELYSLQTGVRGDIGTPQAIGKPRIKAR